MIPMKILAIVPATFDTSPGQRFRLEQWEPILRQQGINITWSSFENEALHNVMGSSGNTLTKINGIMRGLLQRFSDVRRARDFDAIYIFREAALLGPAFFERILASTGVPLVFDFDDAVWVRYVSPAHGYLSYLKMPQKTGSIIARCAHVMAGNAYLADYALQFNTKITVIPTTIDTDKYRLPDHKKIDNGVPIIGWSGSFSTVQHLDTLRSALQQLAKDVQFKLHVIGAPTYELSGVDVVAIPWRAATEVEDLSVFEIGIMPLPDEDWTRGKCGLKALQYMALGIPTVCSPVGVNTEIIYDGINGMLAANGDEWITKLKQLLADPLLRHRLGNAAKQTVIEKYSANAIALKVATIFQSLTCTSK
jgi:glycosyltransferase involved in cell wall biosynthesis